MEIDQFSSGLKDDGITEMAVKNKDWWWKGNNLGLYVYLMRHNKK